jgi:RES domain-containing protein
MKLSACKSLPLQPINATWYRAIALKHLPTALQTSHSADIHTRFNPGLGGKSRFEILYLAENQIVAHYEVEAIFGPPQQGVANPRKSQVISIGVSVRLQSVADLTDPVQQASLETSVQELTGNWDTYYPGEAPTQKLGAALFRSKNVEGFLTISARIPGCKTLIVFPQKLRTGSRLVFQDESTGKTHQIVGP